VKVQWNEKDARPNVLNLAAEATQQNMQQAPVTMNNGQPVPIAKDKAEANAVIDVRNTAVPGTYYVTLRGDTVVKYSQDPMDKNKRDVTMSAFAPPIEVTVIPTSVAKLTASPATIKPGASGEINVRVERQFEFAGEFDIQIELPKDTKGITIEPGKIAAGMSEVKLKFTASKDAKLGTINNIVVVATAKWEGQHVIKHETKVNVGVAK
jgi:hypothetical protein